MTGTTRAPQRGPLRLLRAGALVGAALLPALAAHSLAGAPVGPTAALLATVLLWPAAMTLTRVRVRARVLLPTLAAGQGVAHLALSWGHPWASDARLGDCLAGLAHSAHGLASAGGVCAPAGRAVSETGPAAASLFDHLHGASAAVSGLGSPVLAMYADSVSGTVAAGTVTAGTMTAGTMTAGTVTAGTVATAPAGAAMLLLHAVAVAASVLLVTHAEAVLWAVVRVLLPALPRSRPLPTAPRRTPRRDVPALVFQHVLSRPTLRGPPALVLA